MAITANIQSPYPESATKQKDQPQIPASAVPMVQRTGAQIICDALEREGVEVMFGYPGGTIMPFYDAIGGSTLRHVLVRHEQAAAHAADGYARSTGRVGVCIATSGPGATNLVTGLATAFMDSVPIVAITGQVARRFIGTDAFQETDIVGVTQPVTKHSILIRTPEELTDAIHNAFVIAKSGRPGPVLIDIPKDVQQATITVPATQPALPQPNPAREPDTKAIQAAATLIANAKNPLILAGHGIILAQAYTELCTFAEQTQIPVVTTLLGLSAFPESHPLSIGWPGMHGRAEVNRAIHASDLLIAVGMRFDDRVTGNISQFAPNAAIIHIDIDPSEMGKVIAPTVPIVADARTALMQLIAQTPAGQHTEWLQLIHEWHDEAAEIAAPATNDEAPVTISDVPHPRDILAAIRVATAGEAITITDVGQHQMWAATFYGYDKPNSHYIKCGIAVTLFARSHRGCTSDRNSGRSSD